MKEDKRYFCNDCNYQSDEDPKYGICPKCGGCWFLDRYNIVSKPSPTPLVYGPGDDNYGRDKKFWATPPETVEEAAEKFKAEHPLAKTLLTDYFTAGAQWQLRQQLNFPENKQEQLNWFLVNVLRLFDDEQLKVLTKEIGDRCGAFRQEWINVKDTPARRDIEIWAYDDDWHVCTIHPEFAEESDYEAVLFWQPFYRPSPPISK